MRFDWVIEGLRTGVVTTNYPARPDSSIDALRIRPMVFAERCQAAAGCDACIQACLPHALALEQPEGGLALTLDLGRCIGCSLCAAACPDDAMTMTPDIELAVRMPEGLRKVAQLDGARVSTEEGKGRK